MLQIPYTPCDAVVSQRSKTLSRFFPARGEGHYIESMGDLEAREN